MRWGRVGGHGCQTVGVGAPCRACRLAAGAGKGCSAAGACGPDCPSTWMLPPLWSRCACEACLAWPSFISPPLLLIAALMRSHMWLLLGLPRVRIPRLRAIRLLVGRMHRTPKCAMCLQIGEGGCDWAVLACGHEFHVECIDRVGAADRDACGSEGRCPWAGHCFHNAHLATPPFRARASPPVEWPRLCSACSFGPGCRDAAGLRPIASRRRHCRPLGKGSPAAFPGHRLACHGTCRGSPCGGWFDHCGSGGRWHRQVAGCRGRFFAYSVATAESAPVVAATLWALQLRRLGAQPKTRQAQQLPPRRRPLAPQRGTRLSRRVAPRPRLHPVSKRWWPFRLSPLARPPFPL